MNDQPQNWWKPIRGHGEWRVQLTSDRADFGLCVNERTGKRKSFADLKGELYGADWLEVVTEALAHGKRAGNPH
jgi:hypothetical protein